jgi:AcrR family transcriptional regulator
MVAGLTERLTKADWIRHGLRTLAREGPNVLKVGPMATRLEVSRGSFYWHFRDIADFKAQLLQSWAEATTEQVRRELEAEGGEPDRLIQLLRKAFSAGRTVDRAVRAWAADDPGVAKIVAAVDARRVAYVTELLLTAGVDRRRARPRAAFLYWALLGQAFVMDPDQSAIDDAGLEDIQRLFTR